MINIVMQAHNSIHWINSRNWWKDKPFSTYFHITLLKLYQTPSLQQGRRVGPCYFPADIWPVELKTKQQPALLHGLWSAIGKCTWDSESEGVVTPAFFPCGKRVSEQPVNWLDWRRPLLLEEGLGPWLSCTAPTPSPCQCAPPASLLFLQHWAPDFPRLRPEASCSPAHWPRLISGPHSQPPSNLAWSVCHLHLTSLLNFGASLGKGLCLDHARFSVIS